MSNICRCSRVEGYEEELLNSIIKHEANAKCKQGIEQKAQDVGPLFLPPIERVKQKSHDQGQHERLINGDNEGNGDGSPKFACAFALNQEVQTERDA